MGTPEFAVPSLELLAKSEDLEVIAVITQPDKPSGRGQKLTPPPAKVAARNFNIPVYQPPSIKKITKDENGDLVGTEKNQELVDFLNSAGEINAFV